MTQFGTVRNGVIVFDNPAALPDGTRVAFEPAGGDALDDWAADDLPPWANESREEVLASLRKELADIKAGVPGIPAAEAFAQIRAELGLPPSKGV